MKKPLITASWLLAPILLILAPGQHTLQLLHGDGLHIPHDNVVASTPITITVE